MGRLRIMVRGVEQCVRLIWSVIVLRWSYTDFRFRAMPCIKSSQIHSSRAVAGRRLVYGGHAGVYHTTSVAPGPPCVFKVMRGALSQAGLFESSFILAQKPPTSAPLAAARSEQLLLRRRLGEPAMQREIGSVIPDFAGDCVSGAVYQKYPFDRSNSGRSRRLRHGDEGRRAPSADVLRRVE